MSKHEELIERLRASAAAMPFDAAVAVQYRAAADALEAQAREIEGLRKQDDALIQQLVDALEWTVAPPCMCWAGCEACHPANPPNPVAAITAGRARLEGKP